MMTDISVLYMTAPNNETAKKIADILINERLAACVNILAPMQSVYRWDGAVETSAETPLLVKTTAASAGAAQQRIIDAHPYDCPCVIALSVDAAASFAPFLEWIRNNTDPSTPLD